MKIETSPYRVPEGKPLDLRKQPTRVHPLYTSKGQYQDILADHTAKLGELQNLLDASGSHAVLLVLQAMDAAGKDGIIKHVMSGLNPQGCEVFSFKQPSAEELRHDFLWRTTCRLPERGRIGIFNRSYYEEVIIVRVHPELLAAQGFTGHRAVEDTFWTDRFRSIRELEAHLHRNATSIIKIFLHLSKDEQRKRLLERIDEPAKNWKFNPADVAERARWHDYGQAYEACLAATSTAAAPWHVVPADDKKNARLIVSQILLDTLGQLDLAYPEADKERRQELKTIRHEL